MVNEKKSRVAGLIIITAFILGLIIGFLASNIFQSKNDQHFETGQNLVQNSGFEISYENNPAYWFPAIVPIEGLNIKWDNQTFYQGKRSVSISNSHDYNETVSNNWAQTINRIPENKIIELSGYIKTENAENVVMVIQCWNNLDELIGFGTTENNHNITGTTEWNNYSAKVKIPQNTKNIVVRLVLTGTGTVWFDEVYLKIL